MAYGIRSYNAAARRKDAAALCPRRLQNQYDRGRVRLHGRLRGADAGRGAGSSEQPAERRRRGCRQAEQRERDGTWECNDRLIGVAVKARARTRSLNPQPGMRDEVEALFGHDNQLADKDFRLLRNGDAETVRALVRHGNKASGGA